MFSNTGLEYPEVRKFAASFENVETVYPQMTFFNVVKNYGYPIISKEVSEAIYYARRITNDVNKGGRQGEFIQTSRDFRKTTARKQKDVDGDYG